jgi:hypothetical protein
MYPRRDSPLTEIILIDDNTDDESLWRPVEAWCARPRGQVRPLDNWPGFKSGGAELRAAQLTAPEAEVIGIVDSDYQVRPGWLRRCAPDPAGGPGRARRLG